MKTLCLVLVLPIAVVIINCGRRPQSQPAAQQASQPAVTQPPAAEPTTPAQAENTQPAPPPVAQQPPAAMTPQPTAPEKPTPYPSASAARQNQAPATRPEISIPAGTIFDVRLEETIDTKRNRPGDQFDATLTRAIVLNGETVVPRGAHCAGHLIESQSSGRLKGHAELILSLDSFDVNGRHYEIKTTSVARASGGHKKRNWLAIGGGSGFGTMVGAIAGGPVGALIGAGAGAGAGTAGAVITGKKNVRLPVETLLAFTLRRPVVLAN